MDTLRDNPEVFWGFVLALAVVLILTPGVGRFARILGVVDEPGDTLLVLAIPIFDTSFVFAKRLKYRQPLYEADRTHLHHRFMNIGFSQQRAVVYMYVWCGLLAAAALATRFLPPRPHGDWDVSNTLVAGAVALAALAASVYIAYLLEILKLANPRIRRRGGQGGAGTGRSACGRSSPPRFSA